MVDKASYLILGNSGQVEVYRGVSIYTDLMTCRAVAQHLTASTGRRFRIMQLEQVASFKNQVIEE